MINLENCNTSVTDPCNSYDGLTKANRQFLAACIRFNKKQKKSFCFSDFPYMKKGTFRQKLHRIRQFIEVTAVGNPSFYKVKGILLLGDSHKVTLRPMGVSPKLIEILESLKEQPPKIHDIKIKVDEKIHYHLVKKGCTVNTRNHCIRINNIPVSDNNLNVKALVYPKLIQIDIACSYKPLVYDYDSLLQLHQYLTEISIYLTSLSGVKLKPVKDWIITHYHFNKDGSYEVNGRDFHLRLGEVSIALVRFYTKSIEGRRIARLEQLRSPQRTLLEEMLEVLNA